MNLTHINEVSDLLRSLSEIIKQRQDLLKASWLHTYFKLEGETETHFHFGTQPKLNQMRNLILEFLDTDINNRVSRLTELGVTIDISKEISS